MTWEWRWKLPLAYQGVELDFTAVRFMEPWALAMFAAYAAWLRHNNYTVHVRMEPSNPANAYFDAMGLGEVARTGGTSGTAAEWLESHQNTGLHVVRSETDLRAFRQSSSRLTLKHCPDAEDALRWAMVELSRNVLQHAASPTGGFAIAQHFPTDKRLQVAIVDTGRGLLDSLKSRYPELQNDAEALRLAVLPHSSGAPAVGPYGDSLRNAGLGLFTTREIAWRAGGTFWLASGNALLGARGDLESVWEAHTPTPGKIYRRIEKWPGTVVVIDFPVDEFPDFSDIVGVATGLADEARRLSGPAGVDFLPDDATEDTAGYHTITVALFEEDVVQAETIRTEKLKPWVEQGQAVVVDFAGLRAPTQSFVHALLYDVFQVPGSLLRMSFRGCSKSTREVVKAVAAYASYRQIL